MIFWGIDQTGAARDRGQRAVPLPAVALALSGGTWRLRVVPGGLLAANRRGLQRSSESMGVEWQPSLAVTDCVFGLPRSSPVYDEGIQGWLERVQKFDSPLGKYGRAPGEAFFQTLGPANGPRKCEAAAGANSVFQVRPYQKNIQTGTFRIWRDLVEDLAILRQGGDRIFPHADVPADRWQSGGITWLEAYPSSLWKRIFGFPQREPRRITEVLRVFQESGGGPLVCSEIDKIAADPNLADAAVLALGGRLLFQRAELFPAIRGGFRNEGWIAGLRTDEVFAGVTP